MGRLREYEIGNRLVVRYLWAEFTVEVVSKEFQPKYGDYLYGLSSHGDVRHVLGCDKMIIGKVKD